MKNISYFSQGSLMKSLEISFSDIYEEKKKKKQNNKKNLLS